MDVIKLVVVSLEGWINQQVPPETQSRLVPRYITLSERSLARPGECWARAQLSYKTMPHPRSYQPELHPHLIKGLHHEAKLRGVPMTVLLRSIVTQALEPTEGMRIARQELRRAGDPLVSCRRTDTW